MPQEAQQQHDVPAKFSSLILGWLKKLINEISGACCFEDGHFFGEGGVLFDVKEVSTNELASLKLGGRRSKEEEQ